MKYFFSITHVLHLLKYELAIWSRVSCPFTRPTSSPAPLSFWLSPFWSSLWSSVLQLSSHWHIGSGKFILVAMLCKTMHAAIILQAVCGECLHKIIMTHEVLKKKCIYFFFGFDFVYIQLCLIFLWYVTCPKFWHSMYNFVYILYDFASCYGK